MKVYFFKTDMDTKIITYAVRKMSLGLSKSPLTDSGVIRLGVMNKNSTQAHATHNRLGLTKKVLVRQPSYNRLHPASYILLH